MAGPGFEPDATIALPTAKIAVMGAEAAVNAVYANKIAALPSDQERAAFVAQKRAEYEADIDIMRLASELVVDAVVAPHELRGELVRRFALARTKDRHFSRRRHGVTPV
jgi:acetyl-CoA carboxylase carboxyltransferase component